MLIISSSATAPVAQFDLMVDLARGGRSRPGQQLGRVCPNGASVVTHHILQHIERAVAAGDLRDSSQRIALAAAIERDLSPRIIPDRGYAINELEQFGYKRGRLYKAVKTEGLIVRKNGAASKILGRDFLEWIDRMPILGREPAST